MKRKRRPFQAFTNIALSIGSVVLSLLLAEAAIRIAHPSASLWRYPNYIALAAQPQTDQPSGLLQYSPDLGFEPRPGAAGVLAHQRISYSAQGLRNQNAGIEVGPGRPILAVGDSYTEGYGVADDESWPAQLERSLERRVLNGGVRGYGLDQIVLRSKQLLGHIQADAVVLAFIADDVRRTGLAVTARAHRPYFLPTKDGLELHGVPVPSGLVDDPYTWPRRVLGYSYFLDFLMRRMGAWDLWYANQRSSGADPQLVGCRLMPLFAQIVRDAGARALVVALPQYDAWTTPAAAVGNRAVTAGILNCAQAAELRTLDAHDILGEAGALTDPASLYVDWHLNPRGNRLVAEAIARVLR